MTDTGCWIEKKKIFLALSSIFPRLRLGEAGGQGGLDINPPQADKFWDLFL